MSRVICIICSMIFVTLQERLASTSFSSTILQSTVAQLANENHSHKISGDNGNNLTSQ